MAEWPVFITAKTVSAKSLNKAFLLLQDYEFGTESVWFILRDKTLPRKNADLQPVTVPVDIGGDDALTEANNAFSGWSTDDIEDFVIQNEQKLKKLKATTNIWIIIDEKGLESETCLVCQDYDLEEEEQEEEDDDDDVEDNGEEGKYGEEEPPTYQMARIPWVYAWNMYTNLDLANMGFDEWVDEEAGKQDDGVWKYAQWVDDTKDEKTWKKIEDALAKSREEGIIE